MTCALVSHPSQFELEHGRISHLHLAMSNNLSNLDINFSFAALLALGLDKDFALFHSNTSLSIAYLSVTSGILGFAHPQILFNFQSNLLTQFSDLQIPNTSFM